MYQSFDNIEIEAISSCVPKQIIKNDFFSDLLEGKDLRMFEKTVGIYERRWSDDDVTASDLAFKAIENLFISTDIDKDDIKCLLFVSQTSDYKIPFTSNILQDRLGLSNDLMCLDINAGCAGFIQGISTAYSILNSLADGKVLLVIAETLSKILSPNDRSTTMLFGDAASALIISKSERKSNSYLNMFSDGKNFSAIQIPDGGYRSPFSKSSLDNKLKENGGFANNVNLEMDGPKVFDFTLREVSNGVVDLFEHFKIDKNKIDYFLFHQSNKFIISQISNQLGLVKEKVLFNIQSFGNTSGVSLPLLISSNKNIFEGKLHRLLLSGYGSGLTWGNVVLEINSNAIFSEIVEY